MSVSKRGKRTVEYGGQTFVWWVAELDDGLPWLSIVSDDKSVDLSYRVGEGDFFVVSGGRLFQGAKTSGSAERFWYPMSSPPMTITPAFVRELVAWAVDGRDAKPVQPR